MMMYSCRFENAVTFVEKASEMDPRNSEIETLIRNVRMVVRARDRGNALYGSERYTEARGAYAEGLKFDPYNATLFGHRADCFFKVGMWESSIEDCSHALLILPSYTKARRQRAASYGKVTNIYDFVFGVLLALSFLLVVKKNVAGEMG